MPHVVTQACCADASCVFACPVNAIHPTPDEADFAAAEMLYIDPVSCVDCGACVGACPVGAIVPDTRISEAQQSFVEINALFHAEPRSYPPQARVTPIVGKVDTDHTVRVAVVGSGPAALYAADELLKRPGIEVTLIDRLPTPYGLVRAGVAPDHPSTKSIEGLFRQIEDQAGFGYLLNVEVGSDISHAELAAHHHAVVYATGASRDRSLGLPGEQLPGSETATAFVAWYNGHPDHATRTFDLSAETAVIVGNGNVALDVARILATDPEELTETDIADHALEALRRSAVREIVLLGRRGAAQAAFTLPELLGVLARDDIEIVVEGDDLARVEDVMVERKLAALREAVSRPARAHARRIVFRFATSPVRIVGDEHVEAVQVRRNELVEHEGLVSPVPTDDTETLTTSLMLRSVGYRGVGIPGVPFDESAAVIPNAEGRVDGSLGTYVVGWIKRGPSGFIGTNKSCARETVDHLLEDLNAGLLEEPVGASDEFERLVVDRVAPIGLGGWRAIDARERRDGAPAGRPRRKIVDVDELAGVAVAARPTPRPGRSLIRALRSRP